MQGLVLPMEEVGLGLDIAIGRSSGRTADDESLDDGPGWVWCLGNKGRLTCMLSVLVCDRNVSPA